MLAPLTDARASALLSPSARVLVAAAAPDGGASVASLLPWREVHWPTLVSLTSFERAEAQVCRLLRAAPVGAVPEDVLQSMQALSRVSMFRAAELGAAAGRAVDALAAYDVDALWLKGAALAMQSPVEFSRRSMGDLDVLVQPADADRARAALRHAGWTDGLADPSYGAHHHDAPMLWRGGARLELHGGLFPPGHPFVQDDPCIWLTRGVVVPWGGRTVRVLTAPWHLVHASAHWAWSHEGEVGTWQYLHDAHDLVSDWRAGDSRWAEVAVHAREMGAAVPVGWALWAGARLGGIPVAEQLLAGLRGRRRPLSGIAEREWVVRAIQSPVASPSVAWSRYWWRYAMRGLGDANRRWPWRAGRMGAGEPSQSTGTVSVGTKVVRWRRHLARVLGG